MKSSLLLLACCGCTALQSARTLAPRTTEVSVGLGRAAAVDSDFDEGEWTGRLMVRRGLVDGFDLGFAIEHTPGTGGIGSLTIDPKLRLSSAGRSTLALGLRTGIVWSEGTEVVMLGAVVAPSMYLSVEAAPSVELISNVHFVFNFVENITGSRYDRTTGYGGALGLRFTEEARTWAVTPQLGLLHVDATRYSQEATLLTFGVTIAVGSER
jgi:hypothetical protein